MLDENKFIDQLFRTKLGDYEKTPPMFVWTNIRKGLTEHRMVRRILWLKAVGIAAALLLAFLAGWQLTTPSLDNAALQNSVAKQQMPISREINSAANEHQSIEKQIVADEKVAVDKPETILKSNRTSASNLSSLAAFAPNTSILDKEDHTVSTKVDDLILFETEKDFLDKMHQNFKGVKKLSDWLASIGKDSLKEVKNAPAVIHPDIFKNYTAAPARSTVAVHKPTKNNFDRWMLKAEFAPMFNNQSSSSNSTRVSDALANNGGFVNQPQETSSENTFSGGMVAGYKVSRRFVVKSGVVYNTIRQTTRNVDFMAANPLYNVAGNATIAATPAGQVSLTKTSSNTGSKAFLNADSQTSMATKYTAPNELKQDIGFIEIPVQATYKLVDNKFNVGLTGGISTNILVGNKAVLSENGVPLSNGETSNMRNVVYSGAVGIEVGYEISNHLTLTVEPRLKHFINSLSTSKAIDYKPSQIGVVTGLTYSFN